MTQKLTLAQIIKIAVDVAMDGIVDGNDGSSYYEQALDACESAIGHVRRIEMFDEKYVEPTFLYGEECLDDIDEDLIERFKNL